MVTRFRSPRKKRLPGDAPLPSEAQRDNMEEASAESCPRAGIRTEVFAMQCRPFPHLSRRKKNRCFTRVAAALGAAALGAAAVFAGGAERNSSGGHPGETELVLEPPFVVDCGPLGDEGEEYEISRGDSPLRRLRDRRFGEKSGYGFESGEGFRSWNRGVWGTEETAFFLTGRLAPESYTFLLPPGRYAVILGFCELLVHDSGRRRFDILVQGETVVSDLDPFAVAGFGQAFTLGLAGKVREGERLTIVFRNRVAADSHEDMQGAHGRTFSGSGGSRSRGWRGPGGIPLLLRGAFRRGNQAPGSPHGTDRHVRIQEGGRFRERAEVTYEHPETAGAFRISRPSASANSRCLFR